MIYQVETNQSPNRKDIPYGTVVTPALPSWEAALEAAKTPGMARLPLLARLKVPQPGFGKVFAL